MQKCLFGKGFSLVEIIVAVSVLVVLAGIAIPVISSQVDKAKAGKIVSLADTLSSVCRRYRSDTGEYPAEYSESSYTSDAYHKLSVKQNTKGWDGPYIDHPLSRGDNPFDSYVFLYPNLSGGTVKPNGFDLKGRGSITHAGDGNFIGFGNIPETVALLVDDALDRGMPGSWKSTGRVEYSGKKLAIYLCGGEKPVKKLSGKN